MKTLTISQIVKEIGVFVKNAKWLDFEVFFGQGFSVNFLCQALVPAPPHFWPQVSVWFLSSHCLKRFFLFFFKWEIWTASKAKSTSTLFGLILEKSKKIGSFCKTPFFLQFPSVWAKAGPSQGGQRIFKDYFFVTKFWGQNFGEIRSFPKFDCTFSVKVNTPWTCNIFHKI